MVNKLFASKVIIVISLLTLLLTSLILNEQLKNYNHTTPSQNMAYQIPSNIQIQLVFGYNAALATLHWFYLINTLGGYDASEKKEEFYINLAKELDLITRLNPRAEHAYYMAATILPWETHSTILSQPLLDRAIKNMPNAWQWPYYKGFNAYWFGHDYQKAARYLELSARQPNAPTMIRSLAIRMHTQAGNIDTAINFLNQLLQKNNNSTTSPILLKQYKRLITEKQLRNIDNLLTLLPDNQHNQDGLKALETQSHHIPKLLEDGGTIIFINNQPVSSIDNKRLKIFIPPKRQGVIHHEAAH